MEKQWWIGDLPSLVKLMAFNPLTVCGLVTPYAVFTKSFSDHQTLIIWSKSSDIWKINYQTFQFNHSRKTFEIIRQYVWWFWTNHQTFCKIINNVWWADDFSMNTAYGDIYLGHHWLRWWLGAWWHQAILTWANADLLSLQRPAW